MESMPTFYMLLLLMAAAMFHGALCDSESAPKEIPGKTADGTAHVISDVLGETKEAPEKATTKVFDASDHASEVVKEALDEAKKATERVKEALNEVKKATEGVKEATEGVKEALDEVKKAKSGAKETLDEATKAASESVKETLDKVKVATDGAKETLDEATKAASETAKEALDKVKVATDGAKETLDEAIKAASETAKEALDKPKKAVSDDVSGDSQAEGDGKRSSGESVVVDEKMLEYAQGSVCGYCTYCKFCPLCDNECPCETSSAKPNCHMCKYCPYCSLCSPLCDTVCVSGGIIDIASGAIVNSLPSFNKEEVDEDIESVSKWVDKDEL